MAARQECILWPNGRVPYVIGRCNRDLEDIIYDAMDHIEEKSSVKFVKRNNQRVYMKVYRGNGCYASTPKGRTGGEQLLSLGSTCEEFGSVLHELMYMLGFHHEHQRPDRDDYIRIREQNIVEECIEEFFTIPDNDYVELTPFDYHSVMMYDSYAFSIDPGVRKTIVAIDGSEIEGNDELSRCDVRKLRLIYG